MRLFHALGMRAEVAPHRGDEQGGRAEKRAEHADLAQPS
jgi:hypothetical protein